MKCALCGALAEDSTLATEIMEYIAENIRTMDRDEIAGQVVAVLQGLGKQVLPADVLVHLAHVTDQRIVIPMLLKDTLDMSQTVRQGCVVHCPETDAQSVDPKTVAIYLKTVDTITALYRFEVACRVQK